MPVSTVLHLYLGLPEGAAPPRTRYDVASRALIKVAPDGSSLPVPPAVFDILVEVRVPSAAPELSGAVRSAIADALGPAPRFDPGRSAVLAGVEHTVIPGSGDALAVGLIRRLPGLGRRDFISHWMDRHVAFAHRVSGSSGYRQLHAVPEFSRSVAEELGIPDAGFDGAGLMFVPDLASMSQVRSSPQVRRHATEDEMRFVDHSRSHFFSVEASGRSPGRDGERG